MRRPRSQDAGGGTTMRMASTGMTSTGMARTGMRRTDTGTGIIIMA